MDVFESLKAALDEWINEDPAARRYARLTAGDISEILSRAKTLEAKSLPINTHLLERMGA